jgi:hypothetical protein
VFEAEINEAEHWNKIKKFHDPMKKEEILETPIGFNLSRNYGFPVETDKFLCFFYQIKKLPRKI